MNVRRLNAAQSAASGLEALASSSLKKLPVVLGVSSGARRSKHWPSSRMGATRTNVQSGSWACALAPERYAKRQAAQGWSAFARVEASRFQAGGTGCTLPSVTKPLPNPSLERTSTGEVAWARGFSGYKPPRGQATSPVEVRSAQTLGRR